MRRSLGGAGAAHGVDDGGGGRAAASACARPWPLVLGLRRASVVTLIDPWALLQPGFWLSFRRGGLLMARSRAPRRRRGAGAAAAWSAGREVSSLHRVGGLSTQVGPRWALRPHAADDLPAGVAGGLLRQPDHSCYHLMVTLAGAAGSPAATAVDARRRAAAALAGNVANGWPACLAAVERAGLLWAQAAGLLGRPCCWCCCCGGCGCWRAAAAALLARRRSDPPPARSRSWRSTCRQQLPVLVRTRGTCSSTTPARSIRARATPASVCCCRCCAPAASAIDRLC